MKRIAFAVLAMLPFYAQAGFILFETELDGANELPPVTTDATGFGLFGLDTVTNDFGWFIYFQDLSAEAVAAHIHEQPSGSVPGGENGPVEIDLAFLAGQGGILDSIGDTAGLFLGTTVLDASQIANLLAGLWYVNIHSPTNPGGEIRGQIVAVPEPGALALLGSGLIGLAFVRRKRAA
jgi:hypothetical protein